MSRDFDRLKAAAAALADTSEIIPPAWHQRPTMPGLWLCCGETQVTEGVPFAGDLIDITPTDIVRGVPYRSSLVFGPIPLPEVMS